MKTLRLIKYLRLTAELKLVSGLRIGGASDKVEIGGVDNPVIKDKLGFPYIPGSSLKGKLRTLIEFDTGKASDEIHSCQEEYCPVCRLFGHGNTKDNDYVENGPARLIVRDARLSGDSASRMPFEVSEIKTEVTISRVTGTAGRGGPRQMERVPAGETFKIEIVCRVFDKSDEYMFNHYIPKALELLELDCLGGSGSRGYGKVALSELKLYEGNSENPFCTWKTIREMKAALKAV